MSTVLPEGKAKQMAGTIREHLGVIQDYLNELHEAGYDVTLFDASRPRMDGDASAIEFESKTELDLRAKRLVNYTEEV